MMLKLCHWQKSWVSWNMFYRTCAFSGSPFIWKGFFSFLPVVLDAKPPQCSTLTSWSNFTRLKTNSKVSVLISKHWGSLGLSLWFSCWNGLQYAVRELLTHGGCQCSACTTGAAGLLCQTALASGRLSVNQRRAGTCSLSSLRHKYFAFVMDSTDKGLV